MWDVMNSLYELLISLTPHLSRFPALLLSRQVDNPLNSEVGRWASAQFKGAVTQLHNTRWDGTPGETAQKNLSLRGIRSLHQQEENKAKREKREKYASNKIISASFWGSLGIFSLVFSLLTTTVLSDRVKYKILRASQLKRMLLLSGQSATLS